METNTKSAFKKFSQGYTFKILLLVVLVLLLLIPLAMIRGLINERDNTAALAETDIMEAWGSQLIEAGPFIAIPGVRYREDRTKTERNGELISIVKTPFTLVIMPKKLSIGASFKTEIRRRGIFSVPLFSGSLALSGSFNPAAALATVRDDEEIFLNQAEIIITLSSQKGIRKIDSARWNSQDLFFQPGNRGHSLARYSYNNLGNGIYAALDGFSNSESNFEIAIAIQGGQFVRFLPVGQDTHVEIAADWASPSFQGSFLPNESNMGDNGFDAAWDISYLSRDIPLFWKTDGEDHEYSGSLFGVNFFRAIDTYSLNTRAVKYAILFLIVPFLTLFLLEIFTKKRIHPVPYLLSGIANIIFYLLLLSLSEQMRFYFAYLIAALAVTIMMTLYSRSLLSAWNKSWYMGLVVVISYVLLYAVLNAESYALLIGSIGAFIVVALVMFLTRKLDWYAQDSIE
ncbi:MAG: cell envelope integrity protein CreD [Treponema sp.]|jgi:inner membrane protein|nr:cell envelope integrity protein CreD [Treponema sp.]